MNRKAVIATILALTALGVGYFFFRPKLQSTVGDVRPALLPPASSPPQVSGRPADRRLRVPEGYKVTLFAAQTPGARDLQLSPDGTLLVSLRTQGKVIALPDKDQDGVADEVREVLTNLQNPHGLAFHEGKLFIAEERQLNRYTWNEESLTASLEKKLFDAPNGVTLPGGGGHQTRSIVFDNDGNLYISVGSTCNVCIQENPWHGSVIVTNAEGENPRIFATGLRNAVFLTTHPETDAVWVAEMGRDMLGDNIPPDEINILRDGAHYGWPYCYDDRVYDRQFGSESAAFCEQTLPPVFKIQAHSAPLGLTFIQSNQFPTDWQGDLFVAYHGSWNRSEPTGYKVVRLNVEGEQVTGQEDF